MAKRLDKFAHTPTTVPALNLEKLTSIYCLRTILLDVIVLSGFPFLDFHPRLIELHVLVAMPGN